MIAALGLGVGKCSLRTDCAGKLDVVYIGDAFEGSPMVRRVVLLSKNMPFAFPGDFAVVAHGPDGITAAGTFAVAAAGASGFAVRFDVPSVLTARGLGLIDPDDERSLLVSWWTGEVEPYGIVKYSIRDDRTIEGYYLSKMSPDVPGRDTVIGDTTHGFNGRFELMSKEVSGRTWGPHQWDVETRGDLVDLTWTEHGKVFCRGLGIVDPKDHKAIIANYIPV